MLRRERANTVEGGKVKRWGSTYGTDFISARRGACKDEVEMDGIKSSKKIPGSSKTSERHQQAFFMFPFSLARLARERGTHRLKRDAPFNPPPASFLAHLVALLATPQRPFLVLKRANVSTDGACLMSLRRLHLNRPRHRCGVHLVMRFLLFSRL